MEPHETDFETLAPLFPDMPAIRNFVVIDVDCIRDSCGYGVPLYEFKKQRESIVSSKRWARVLAIDYRHTPLVVTISLYLISETIQ